MKNFVGRQPVFTIYISHISLHKFVHHDPCPNKWLLWTVILMNHSKHWQTQEFAELKTLHRMNRPNLSEQQLNQQINTYWTKSFMLIIISI